MTSKFKWVKYNDTKLHYRFGSVTYGVIEKVGYGGYDWKRGDKEGHERFLSDAKRNVEEKTMEYVEDLYNK